MNLGDHSFPPTNLGHVDEETLVLVNPRVGDFEAEDWQVNGTYHFPVSSINGGQIVALELRHRYRPILGTF
ncbi:hypothetical protein TNCV_3715061 [Trichonephila clavipes]|nr:hypothetical protein TNCV_3715061 [Trichonephila clavipes]